MLNKTGEINPEDVTLLRTHPAVVQDLEGFKDHLHKFVLRGMRAAKGDSFEPVVSEGEAKRSIVWIRQTSCYEERALSNLLDKSSSSAETSFD
jgi:hypothetical protein